MKKNMPKWLPLALDIGIATTVFVSWIAMMVASPDALSARGLGSLKYFTVLSNLLLGITCCIRIPYSLRFMKEGCVNPHWLDLLLFVSVIGTSLTLLTVVFFLGPLYGYLAMFAGANLFFHLLVPVAGFLQFEWFGNVGPVSFKESFFGLVPESLYAVFYVANFFTHLVRSDAPGVGPVYDWYGFVGDANPIRIVVVLLVMAIATYGISAGVWAVKRSLIKKIKQS